MKIKINRKRLNEIKIILKIKNHRILISLQLKKIKKI